MVDVDTSRLYEVLPMELPSSAPAAWTHNSKLKHSKSYTGSSSSAVMPPASYSTYAVPRGMNGTPPSSRPIPPAVPPRNRNMSEGGEGSQGSSPNDKGGMFPSKLKPSTGILYSHLVLVTPDACFKLFQGSPSLPVLAQYQRNWP